MEREFKRKNEDNTNNSNKKIKINDGNIYESFFKGALDGLTKRRDSSAKFFYLARIIIARNNSK